MEGLVLEINDVTVWLHIGRPITGQKESFTELNLVSIVHMQSFENSNVLFFMNRPNCISLYYRSNTYFKC